MADGGFTADGPYLRNAARELSEALAAARAIVGWGRTMQNTMGDVGGAQLAAQILDIASISKDTMAALVAKGEAVAVGLLIAADRYDLAEERAWEALQYPAPLLPPSQRTDTTPPPIDMTQPVAQPDPTAPAGPTGAGAAG